MLCRSESSHKLKDVQLSSHAENSWRNRRALTLHWSMNLKMFINCKGYLAIQILYWR